MTPIERPSSLRLWGFLLTVVGGFVAALGAALTWAIIRIRFAPSYGVSIKGIDVWEGKLALGAAVLAIICFALLRVMSSVGVRRALGLAIVVAGLAALLIGGIDAARADARFASPGEFPLLAEKLRAAADLPKPLGQLLLGRLEKALQAITDVDTGVGLWLVIAGGAVTAVGGVLDVAWVGRERLRALPPRDSSPAASP